MTQLLVELHYLPSIAYFTAIYSAKKIWVEACEPFGKRSYRNRCRIMTANGLLDLSVPVHGANRKIPIRQVEIDYHEKWVNNHWRAIQSAYGKAPFFDFYAYEFEDALKSGQSHVFDLNYKLLTICLRFLQIDREVVFTEKMENDAKGEITDLRNVISPRKSIEELTWFSPQAYYQIFGKNFAPNLSIIDLLFCAGPSALEVLRQSSVTLENK